MNADSPFTIQRLLDFLERLERARIWHRLDHIRDAILLEVSVPSGKWEIEFFADGHVEVERFRSDGQIGGGEMLESLFRKFRD